MLESKESVDSTISVISNNDKDIKVNKDNKYDSNLIITKKLNANKWSLIEKPLTESERKRNNIILNLGEVSTTSKLGEINFSSLVTIGEYYYLKIRTQLTDCIKLPPIIEKQKKQAKTSKKIQMILDNCKESVEKKFDKLKVAIKDHPENKIYSDLMLNCTYIEFRIILLMKIIESATSQYKEIQEKEEILLGSKKIINILKNILKKQKESDDYQYFHKLCSVENYEIKLCEQLIIDLDFKITNLSNYCGIKLYDIANRRPKLIYDTVYDETIPDIKLKPYDSQIELATCVKDNISNGFMIFYKTLPGLGKTSMILSICTFIKKSNHKLKVIFCCSDILESVRVQVLRTMYNFNIRFGIANASNSKDEYKITNSWNCQEDSDRELIVADYKSTYLMLKEREKEQKLESENSKLVKKSDYIVFFDEPTVLTDKTENTVTLEYLSRIFYYTPKHLILSSATLPLLNELNNITEHYKNKNPDGLIKEIISNKTLIGCVIKDYKSNIIVPHTYCNNPLELKELILKIRMFPLLGKFYTLPFLMNLNEFCKEYNIHINLDDIESFDQESILENIILLLERICNFDNPDDFEKFKKINIIDIREDVFDNSKLDDKYNIVVHDKIITSHAYKYIGSCLIATNDPFNYVKNNLFPIVEKLKIKLNIKSIHKEYENYLKEKKKYKDEIDNIYSKFTSQDKIDDQLNKLKEPKFNFNKSLEINTEEHLKTFSKYVKTYDSSMLKTYINQEDIDVTGYAIDDNLKFLLYMGIGIYTKDIDVDYSTKVLEMLNDGQLAFIIADETFCYGANYPLLNVIITDEIGDDHSINTILQLIGRTSRIGKSWSGKVYLDNNTCERIIEFFKNPSFNSNEGTNIFNYFNTTSIKIDNEILAENKIIQDKQLKLEEQIKLEEMKKIQKEKEKQEKLQEMLNNNNNADNEFKNWRQQRRENALNNTPKENNNNETLTIQNSEVSETRSELYTPNISRNNSTEFVITRKKSTNSETDTNTNTNTNTNNDINNTNKKSELYQTPNISRNNSSEFMITRKKSVNSDTINNSDTDINNTNKTSELYKPAPILRRMNSVIATRDFSKNSENESIIDKIDKTNITDSNESLFIRKTKSTSSVNTTTTIVSTISRNNSSDFVVNRKKTTNK